MSNLNSPRCLASPRDVAAHSLAPVRRIVRLPHEMRLYAHPQALDLDVQIVCGKRASEQRLHHAKHRGANLNKLLSEIAANATDDEVTIDRTFSKSEGGSACGVLTKSPPNRFFLRAC